MNPTRFLSRVLSFPFLDGCTPQLSLRTQPLNDAWKRGIPDQLDLEKYSSDSVVANKKECLLITHIRATDVVIRLRRIPVGFYVAVKSEYGIQRTLNKPASAGKDMVEWDDEIVLTPDRSSRMSLTLFASFELGQTLGDGEVLSRFETTVGELFDRNGQHKCSKFTEQISSRPSVEIEIEQRVGDTRGYGYAAALNPPKPEEMRQLRELTDSGHRALNRYREFERQQDLDESVQHFERARDLCPLDHPSLATALFNLATAKLIYCRVNDMSPDLDVPINLYRAALRLRPRGHPDHPVTLLSLGVALGARFQRQQDEADETEGKTFLSQVMDTAPADSYAYQASALALRSTAKPELIESRESIEDDLKGGRRVQRLDTALRGIFCPNPCGHALLDHLGILLCVQSDHPGGPVNLARAILVPEDVVRFASEDDPEESLGLCEYSSPLHPRHQHSGDLVDLEKSIFMSEDTAESTPNDPSATPSQLNNTGASVPTHNNSIGNVVDLQRSISLLKDAVKLTPHGHVNKPTWLNELGNALLIRYQYLGDTIDLEQSISIFEGVVQLTPGSHPDKSLRLRDLGSSLLARYELFRGAADLERSISAFKDAVQSIPDGHPDKPGHLRNLGTSFSIRYNHFRDIADLEKSISTFEDTIQLTPNGHPDKPGLLNDLGASYSIRYNHLRDITDLEKSISMFEDAVQFTPDGHQDEPERLNNLGTVLSTRFQHLGDITDLVGSILIFEDAVASTSDDNPDKPGHLNSLGTSFSIRYNHFGDIADLEKSISMLEDAVRLTPDGHLDKPGQLNNLGASLSNRYERFGDIVDLEKSISMFEDAVRFTSDGHPDKPGWLNNLGASFMTRYERFGDIVELERSISVLDDVVKWTPDGHPDKPGQLSNLGTLLLTRYSRLGDIVDLEKSISTYEVMVQLILENHADNPVGLSSLTFSLMKHLQCSGNSSGPDLSRAILYSSQAALAERGSFLHRLQASQLLAQSLCLLRHHSHSLLDTRTVGLLPQSTWTGLSLRDCYRQLLATADDACNAAAVALEADRPELAVEWLEQGRSIMWSQLSQLCTPVDDIHPIYRGFTAQPKRASHELNHASARGRTAFIQFASRMDVTAGLLKDRARRQHALARPRTRLLADIRPIPGFERFLFPKTIDQLSSLAHSGPVIFVNASKHRCDALVVVEGSKRVVHVPLSNTSYDEVTDMRSWLGTLLRHRGISDWSTSHDDPGEAAYFVLSPDDVLGTILSYLWDKVVSPILRALAFSTSDSDDKLPRIFWCPTGPFASLPIHAAGIYGTVNLGDKLSDFAISSYIPTMSALELPPQEDSEAASRFIRLPAVSQANTRKEAHLNGVPTETEVIKVIRELTSLSPFVSFHEADGTIEDVLAKMSETDWVHFACHSTQDPANPLQRGLLDHGNHLTLSDIARLSCPRGGLAFLSAGPTATEDGKLPGEAIHTAAGMLLAGYRGVISTMWLTTDSGIERVAEDVYKCLFQDGKAPDSRQAAEALHYAVQRLRDSGSPFLSWVPFFHVGL